MTFFSLTCLYYTPTCQIFTEARRAIFQSVSNTHNALLFALASSVRYNRNTTSAKTTSGTRACCSVSVAQGVDSRNCEHIYDAGRFTTQTYTLPSGLTRHAFSPIYGS